MILSEFSVTKLFGYLDFKVEITSNRLVLVAENGAGKTTLLRLMYLFLSKQWNKIIEYDFQKISAVIDERTFSFEKSEFDTTYIPGEVITTAIAEFPIYENFIKYELAKYRVEDLLKDDFMISEIESKYDVPIGMVYSILGHLSDYEFKNEKYEWEINILYLPTYRRIERNFNSLFGDLDKRLVQYIRQSLPVVDKQIEQEKLASESGFSETEGDISHIFEALWRARDFERWNAGHRSNFSMELIEFGMDDVQYRFSQALAEKGENNENIVHYLAVCNKYLGEEKEIVLTKSGKYFEIRSNRLGVTLPLAVLSSGEKQILSLMSYLLDKPEKIFIIVDEPELSLSISWQEILISDLLSFKITGIIIATHSPFIVSADLKSFTHGLNEYNR